MVEKREASSLEAKLKEKIMAKEEDVSDKRIKHLLRGKIATGIGDINILDTKLQRIDQLCNIAARLGIIRDDYKVPPGIYAIGSPDKKSPVMVTANYKLTIDKLRIELKGMDIWLLVIDTKGVNVWCAAGKGTFSTEEIIYRVKKHKLNQLVSHNQLILPQLGAPGVSSYEVTRLTGFKAIYGPVYAKDIKEFISNNYNVTEKMRSVDFGLMERVVVSPIEVIMSIKYIPFIYIFFLFMQLLSNGHEGMIQALVSSLMNTVPYVIALFIGTLLFPILLPILPFRMFSMKALVLGVLWSSIVVKFSYVFHYNSRFLTNASNSLLLTSIISFLAMNFTGSTTFTSLSGVKKEVLTMVPIIGLSTALGMVLMVVEKFL